MNADSGKMLALSECDCIPDPNDCKETGAMSLYYMLWNGEFLCETSGGGTILTNLSGTPSLNTERMTAEMLQSYFESEYTVTYSELPERFTDGKEFPAKLKVWSISRSSDLNIICPLHFVPRGCFIVWKM